jgi:ATP-dependent RNA helicase MSS116, mitochondrial
LTDRYYYHRLAQARTGTGKTIAFLLPVLQRIIDSEPALEKKSSNAKVDIRAVIVSPTRELAEQIAQEAWKLTRNTGIQVQTAVGGTGKFIGLRRIFLEGCHILVATPGRLKDLLSDPTTDIRTPNLTAFVLDEADRLLDDGFAPDIQKIESILRVQQLGDRQTLMFSATMNQDIVEQVVRPLMKRGFEFVQTIPRGEKPTHEKVPQKVAMLNGLENIMPALFELIDTESKKDPDFKAIVFFNTTSETALAAAVYNRSDLRRQLNIPGYEVHSRLSQIQRTRATSNFRAQKNAILICSDVAARGMDFPGVTHVIQVGVPKDRDTYIHRLGRTGRAEKSGEGWLLVSKPEFLEMTFMLEGLPITKDPSLTSARVDMTKESQVPEQVAQYLGDAVGTAKRIEYEKKREAYRAGIGGFAWLKPKRLMVDMLNRRAIYGWGMEEQPPISRTLASKLGLTMIEGLIYEDGRKQASSPSSSSSSSSSFSSRHNRSGATTSYHGKPKRPGFGFKVGDYSKHYQNRWQLRPGDITDKSR